MFSPHRNDLATQRVVRRPARPRAAIVAVAATVLIALVAPAGASATACNGADAPPNPSDLPAYADATVCLINEQRAAAALPPLTRNVALDTASAAYARRMVAGSFFAHVAPDGTDLRQRLETVRYVRSHTVWVVGENLAWATGSLAVPLAVDASWMASPGHRANILDEQFREIGVGVAIGGPDVPTDGVTVTTDFGVVGGVPAARARASRAGKSNRMRARRRHRCRRRHRRRWAGGRVDCGPHVRLARQPPSTPGSAR